MQKHHTRLITMAECLEWSEVLAKAEAVLKALDGLFLPLAEQIGDIGSALNSMVDNDSPVVEELREEEYMWQDSFEWGLERIRLLALSAKAQFCPVCGYDTGEPDFEPDDPTVGIFGICWVGECPVHGVFSTDSEGYQELEESS